MYSDYGDGGRRRGLLIAGAGLGTLTVALLLWATAPYTGIEKWGDYIAREKRPEESPTILNAWAQRYLDGGQPALALAAAHRSLLIDNTQVVPRKFLAAYALRQGDWKEAADQCREVLTRNGRDVAAQMGLAAALRGMGKQGEAEAMYRALLTDTSYSDSERNMALSALIELAPQTARPKNLPKTVAAPPSLTPPSGTLPFDAPVVP